MFEKILVVLPAGNPPGRRPVERRAACDTGNFPRIVLSTRSDVPPRQEGNGARQESGPHEASRFGKDITLDETQENGRRAHSL